MRKHGLTLGKVELDELRARIKREKWKEEERESMLLHFHQEEPCRQAVAAGQKPPFEILFDRRDLLMKNGM
jgi:hypothetical protein